MRAVLFVLLAAAFAVLFCFPAHAATPPSISAPAPAPLVLLDTTKGPILIKLYPNDAPLSCAAVLKLVSQKFYDGLKFHRVTDLEGPGLGHIAQVGDPASRNLPAGDPRLGQSSYGQPIKGEFSSNGVNNPLVHNPGAVGMARTSDSNSATSQFYICTTAVHSLDGNYAVFGMVIKGLDNAKKIQVGDKIIKATVIKPSK